MHIIEECNLTSGLICSRILRLSSVDLLAIGTPSMPVDLKTLGMHMDMKPVDEELW